MQQKAILGAVVVMALLAGGFAVWKFHSTASQPYPITNSTPLIDEKTAFAQLQADVQSVKPYFVVDKGESRNAIMVPEEQKMEQKIRDDLVMLYAARYYAMRGSIPADRAGVLVEAKNGIWLDAVGKKYILVTETDVKMTRDVILDLQTGQVTPITNKDGESLHYSLAPERNIALYIEPQVLFTYSLDQATTTLVAGSKLQGTETYKSGLEDGPSPGIIPQETHTKNNITISIFDSSRIVPSPDVPERPMHAKIGQKTLSF